MSSQLTSKENYLRLLSGQQPEWVPQSSFRPSPSGKAPPSRNISPGPIMEFLRTPGNTKDIWGVPHVPCVEAGNSKIPEPGNFILDDITKWRDVIKRPDISHIDWEAVAKKDLEEAGLNWDETAKCYSIFITGFFQSLVGFMGFTEALCAMIEEPEEVKAFLEFICDFYMEVGEKTIDYYKPDTYNISEDTAAWRNPFFSLEMYRDLIKPFNVRQAKFALDRGLPIEMHNCGRCEDFIDDWFDFGVVAWNPAQTSNDLLAIKKKYGNKLVICGGWDIVGELANPDVAEETVKQSVYEAIDKYAPGGGYSFSGGYMGPFGDPETTKKNNWIAEAVDSYGGSFYKK